MRSELGANPSSHGPLPRAEALGSESPRWRCAKPAAAAGSLRLSTRHPGRDASRGRISRVTLCEVPRGAGRGVRSQFTAEAGTGRLRRRRTTRWPWRCARAGRSRSVPIQYKCHPHRPLPPSLPDPQTHIRNSQWGRRQRCECWFLRPQSRDRETEYLVPRRSCGRDSRAPSSIGIRARNEARARRRSHRSRPRRAPPRPRHRSGRFRAEALASMRQRRPLPRRRTQRRGVALPLSCCTHCRAEERRRNSGVSHVCPHHKELAAESRHGVHVVSVPKVPHTGIA